MTDPSAAVNVSRAVLLAAGGDDQQKAAPLGLFVLLLLGVACYFLFKSMSRHLKRVREDFPLGSSARPTATTAAGSGSVDPAAEDVSRPANQQPNGADEGGQLRPR